MIKCKLFNYLVHDIKLNEIITEIIVDIQREFVELFVSDKLINFLLEYWNDI